MGSLRILQLTLAVAGRSVTMAVSTITHRTLKKSSETKVIFLFQLILISC